VSWDVWQVQVFPDACRSLSGVLALCFSFIDPAGKEIRVKGKEKKKKIKSAS
jgi:hypothetical protein